VGVGLGSGNGVWVTRIRVSGNTTEKGLADAEDAGKTVGVIPSGAESGAVVCQAMKPRKAISASVAASRAVTRGDSRRGGGTVSGGIRHGRSANIDPNANQPENGQNNEESDEPPKPLRHLNPPSCGAYGSSESLTPSYQMRSYCDAR
jgi:hypothetical protein